MITLLCLCISALCLAEAVFGPAHPAKRRYLWVAWGAAWALVFMVLFWRFGGGAQTLAYLAMPTGWLWLAGIAAFAFFHARRAVGARNFTVAIWLVYTAAGSNFAGQALLHPSENAFAEVDPFSAHYDVVHVLGGGTRNYGSYAQIAASGDRVMLGARLWHGGHTPVLLTTGSTPQSSLAHHNSAQTTAQLWQELGIPPERVLVEPSPTNTFEEMVLLQSLQARYGWERIGVVSSARHLRRVMQNAERVQIDILPLPADFRTSPQHGLPSFISLIPTGAGFLMVHNAAWEWLARTVNH